METAAGDFNIRIDSGPDAVVAMSGDLDLSATASFATATDPVFDEDVRTVTLDMSDVTFLDSSGLGALLNLHARAQAAGVTLTMINAPQQVRRVLELTRLTERFNLH